MNSVQKTHGYSPRDLVRLVRELVNRGAIRAAEQGALSLTLTQLEVESALQIIRPSLIVSQQFRRSIPPTSWSAIGGYANVIARIRQTILDPLLNPESFNKLGIRLPSGILLCGPTG